MAHADQMSGNSAENPVLVLGGLGLVSAVASSFVPESAFSFLTPFGDLLFLDGTSVHPALLFAPVIAYGVWAFGKLRGAMRWAGAAFAFVMTVLGWSGAVMLARTLHDFRIGASWMPNDLLIPGMAAGALGAAMVFLGGAVSIHALRQLRNWGPALLTGALAGLLLWIATESDYDPLGPFCLFAVWQTAVAAWFGRGLRDS